MKRIKVTGENGFIASHLIQYLKARGDAVNEEGEVDEVYHLGAKTSGKGTKQFNAFAGMDNVYAMIELLQKYKGKRVVFTSTLEVDYIPWSDLSDRWAYAYSKSLCEKVLSAISLDYVIVRLGNVYGENMKKDYVVKSLCQRIARGEELLTVDNPSDTRTFCYVSDIVEGLVQCMESGEAINATVYLTGQHEVSIGDLTNMIIDISKKKITTAFVEEPGVSPERRLPKMPGIDWNSQVSLREGLEKTYEYYSNL